MIWKFFIQISLGVYHLHSQKILHWDIKSLNIFLTNGRNLISGARDRYQIRIGDLGVAKILASAEHFIRARVGTPYYLSPEVCEDRPYNNKSDIWALGCVLYELCALRHPFEAWTKEILFSKIIKGHFSSIPKHYSKDLSEILQSCLATDQQKRFSIEDIIMHSMFQ